MSRELVDHLQYFKELGVAGVSRDPQWRVRPMAVEAAADALKRGEHFGERAEACDQLLGERFDIALWDGAEQDELQQFVVWDGIGAGIAAALERSGWQVVKHCMNIVPRYSRPSRIAR